MKRIAILLAIILVMLPLSNMLTALAENTLPWDFPEDAADRPTQEELGYPEFVIGATTTLSGTFFTNMWGNNTCDIDVRSLIHGYSPVVWTMQSRFELDYQVLEAVQVRDLIDGNKQYLVSIKPDLTYNNGMPITARDYLFSMMLFADPEIHKLGAISTNSGFLAGYEEYLSGESEVFSGLRLMGDYSYLIEINGEFLPFFFELAMLDALPYPIQVIAPGCDVFDDGEGAYIANIDRDAPPLWTAENLRQSILDPDTGYLSHPYITCGPYMLTDFDWDTREARFDLNPYYKGYYDGQKPTIDHLVFTHMIPEDMIARYLNGEIHLLNKVVYGDNIMEGMGLIGTGEALMSAYPRMGAGFLSFSCEQGPMQFEAVRKAVAYSLDRQLFTDEFTQSFGLPVHGYYGMGQWMVNMVTGEMLPDDVLPEDMDAWDLLKLRSLSDLTEYGPNPDTAKRLLVQDGWVLNEKGEPFAEGTDDVRCKLLEDGTLMPLRLRYAQMQDSVAAQLALDMLTEPLKALGITIEATVMLIEDLFPQYYRQVEREYDLMYIATNFISIFDPYFVFNTGDAYQGTQNTTGYRDIELEELAFDLRSTPNGAMLEYCQKWVAFQTKFNAVLPMLPLYSNVYFDFHVTDLYNYDPQAEMNWPVAILYAVLGEPPAEEDMFDDWGDMDDMFIFDE
ncbi:MAG: ABC transporter substrate-binding protein [Clostridia bacterium]|nr:ABC transporter substrate-binding protein [Clostridia bacterium]